MEVVLLHDLLPSPTLIRVMFGAPVKCKTLSSQIKEWVKVKEKEGMGAWRSRPVTLDTTPKDLFYKGTISMVYKGGGTEGKKTQDLHSYYGC